MIVYWIGRVAYRAAWDLQEQLRRQVQAGAPDLLLLCEHDPVLTLGHAASPADILVADRQLQAAGIDRVVTNRGGQVTYHGPGQIVAYPIRVVSRGVKAHVAALGQAAVAVAAGRGVHAECRADPVGVFCGARKLAAMGVNVKHRVTVHGLAINVTPEASAAFRRGFFHPCGQAGAQVTSLAEEAAAALTVDEVVEPLGRALCEAFGRPYPGVRAIPAESLLARPGPVE